MPDPRDEMTALELANIPRIRVTPDRPPLGTVLGQSGAVSGDVESQFQQGIRATPWFSEFKQKYGEEPNLNDPNYDYRKAWAAGARPDVRDPGDGLYHWPSQFKGENHPNRYVNGVDTITGQPANQYTTPKGMISELPAGTSYRYVEPEPSLPPMQGRAPLEPDQSPGPSVWQPTRTPWQDVQALGGLVRQGFNRLMAGPPAENRQRFEGPYTAPQTAVQGAGHVLGALVDPARQAVQSQQIRFDPSMDPLTQEQARQAGPGAAAEVSMNLLGINAPFSVGRTGLGMFGSARSPGADLMKLARAETMEKAGASVEQIRKETGWLRGADKQWMYEFSDAGAHYKGDVDSIARGMFDRTWPSLEGKFGQRGYTDKTLLARDAARSKIEGLTPTYLEDVVHHPELFRNEPKARKVPVENDPTMWGSGAYFELNPKEPKGRIKYREEDTPDKLARGRTLENILHETSHFLDNLYGMPRGTSPNAGNVGHAGTQANVIYQRLRAQNPIPPKLTFDEFKAKFGKGDTEARFAEYERSYNAQYRNQDMQLRQKAADEDYRINAGENKAEAVTSRMHMTPEQLQAISPEWNMKVPFAEQTVEYNRFRPRDAPPGPVLEYPTTQSRVKKPAILKGSDIPVEQIIEAGHIPQGTNRAWMLRYDPTTGAANLAPDPGHGFSGLTTGKRPEDMLAGYTGTAKNAPQRIYDPSKLEGSSLVLGVTDRTFGAPDTKLNQLGGLVLPNPVAQEGGIGFVTSQAGKKIPDVPKDVDPLFASVSKAAAGRITNYGRAVQEAGGTPYFSTINMAHGAGDSSKQVAKSALRVAQEAKPSDDAVKAIDNAMNQMMSGLKGKPPSPYPGFADPNIEKWLDDAGLPFRSAFVKALDTKKVQAAGIPDIGEVRFGNTDPRLYSTPSGSGGLVVGKMRPEVGYSDFPLHSNYPNAFFGQKGEIGGLPGSVPFPLIAPDLHRLLLPRTDRFGKSFANLPPYYVMQGMPGGTPPVQKMTPEVIDYLGRWFRKHPTGWAAAGAVPLGAAAMGSTVQPNRMDVY